ncbi:hypothetical protein CesoFtcFv8_013459 [Champsocephalus esox]|uniref:Uncharacterized protein n=1 Tax=Champsocephalus esox TaxID=159716 RepID=A0AAN8GTQ5_9TELE|nr:hypothetical protein CesoFtcFv8_013459 [Champsocephalus esox]
MFHSGYLSTSLDCCHWMVKRHRWITSGSSVLLGGSRRPAGSPSLGHPQAGVWMLQLEDCWILRGAQGGCRLN